MGALFIFILISVLVISALLFFNKGEKAQEIKTVIKDIYENFKELLSNLKKLFLILKELIQSKLDQEPTRIKDESTTDNSSNDSMESKPEISSEPESVPNLELETSSNDLTESQTEISSEPESVPTIELETSSNDSTESQTEISSEPESVPTIELETSSDVPIDDQNSDKKTSEF